MYCRKCGKELAQGAKFCDQCGCPVIYENESPKRDKKYAGEIFKCPNCGEIINSFEANCPACGYELREVKSSRALQEFSSKLETIEKQRKDRRGLFSWYNAQQIVSKTDEQKIELIKNFSVPNSKEDMLEFMILAISNIKITAYDYFHSSTKAERDLNAAWLSKATQIYEKARIVYSTEDIFQKIEEIYIRCKNDIRKSKRNAILKSFLVYGGPVVLILLIVGSVFLGIKISEDNEVKRLEELEVAVQQEIDIGDFDYALNLADTIDYQKSDIKKERKWDIQRDYWVKKVLKEAKLAGIELDYTYSEDIDNANIATPMEPSTDNKAETISEISSGENISAGIDSYFEGIADMVDEQVGMLKEMVDLEPIETELNHVSEEAQATIEVVENECETEEMEEDKSLVQMNEEDDTSIAKTSSFHIVEGAQYTCGRDEWSLYSAKAITDTIITIEKWGKNTATDRTHNYEYDVGTYKINDPDNEFTWVDEKHNAFMITFRDEQIFGFNKNITEVFIINPDDNGTYKGSSYNENRDCYIYTNDDWHQYKAIRLSDTQIKIECWQRFLALGSYFYGYDVCLVELDKLDTDFQWAGDTHEIFTITIRDENNGELDKEKFVTFKLEE